MRVGSNNTMLSMTSQFQHDCPMMTGSFNGWEEPCRMIPVREFSHFVDKKKPEFFAELRKKGLISKAPQKYQELNEREKKEYQARLPEFKKQYEPEIWKQKMARLLKYRRPCLVNLFEMDVQTDREVWVTAAFVKPGTHTFIVSDLRGDRARHHHNLHECTVDPRVEPILPYERITKIKSGDEFQRWKTIFAPWPNEGEPMFRQCIEHDVKLWKVTRLIKDQDDYNGVVRTLTKHAKTLVHLFLFLASKSQFPAIGLLDLGAFCQDSRIVDAKFISSTVDRQFIAATSANPNIVIDDRMAKMRASASKTELLRICPDGALLRYQFIEILVRIAGAKYKGQTYTAFKKEPELIDTYSRALEVLIEEHIIQQFDYETPETIRFSKIWKNDSAAIFRANQGLIFDLMKTIQKKKKFLSFDATFKMIEKVEKPEQQPPQTISLKEFTQLYGMSKLLIVEESH